MIFLLYKSDTKLSLSLSLKIDICLINYNFFSQQEKTFHQKGEDYDKIQNSLKFSENNRSQLQPKEMDKVGIFLTESTLVL